MKVLFFSDSHGNHNKIDIPDDIDMAIFGGDAGTYRNPIMNVNGVLDFIEWYGSLTNIKYKIWVAGNHDTSIERGLVDARQLSREKGLIYLEHESCEVDGIKIFGSPYSPTFGYDWAFNVDRGWAMEEKWKDIPEGLDILITHGGPSGKSFLMTTLEGNDVGCRDLAARIAVVKPKISIFGHIHEGYGTTKIDDTTYINASILNRDYRHVNKPFIIYI